MYRLHTKGEVAKSLGNQARGVQPACTMTTCCLTAYCPYLPAVVGSSVWTLRDECITWITTVALPPGTDQSPSHLGKSLPGPTWHITLYNIYVCVCILYVIEFVCLANATPAFLWITSSLFLTFFTSPLIYPLLMLLSPILTLSFSLLTLSPLLFCHLFPSPIPLSNIINPLTSQMGASPGRPRTYILRGPQHSHHHLAETHP